MQALVSKHEATIHGDALLFVTHICSVGATANSNEHDVGLKYLTVCQGYLCTVSVLLNLLKESTSIELDATLLEGTLKNLDDGGIFVRNEVGQTLDNSDVYAHSFPHGGKLTANDAASENDSALRQVVHFKSLGGGQNSTFNRQAKSLRNRAGSKNNILALVIRTVDGHGILSGQLAFTSDNLYALHLQKTGETLEFTRDNTIFVIAYLTHFDGL